MILGLIRRVFRRITPAEFASRELADVELELLAYMSHRDQYQAHISGHEARIKRLRAFLAKLETT